MYYYLRPDFLLYLWPTQDSSSLKDKENRFLQLSMICKLDLKYSNIFILWSAGSLLSIYLLKILNILSHILRYYKLYYRQNLRTLLKRRFHSVIPMIFLKLNFFLKTHLSLLTTRWQINRGRIKYFSTG